MTSPRSAGTAAATAWWTIAGGGSGCRGGGGGGGGGRRGGEGEVDVDGGPGRGGGLGRRLGGAGVVGRWRLPGGARATAARGGGAGAQVADELAGPCELLVVGYELITVAVLRRVEPVEAAIVLLVEVAALLHREAAGPRGAAAARGAGGGAGPERVPLRPRREAGAGGPGRGGAGGGGGRLRLRLLVGLHQEVVPPHPGGRRLAGRGVGAHDPLVRAGPVVVDGVRVDERDGARVGEAARPVAEELQHGFAGEVGGGVLHGEARHAEEGGLRGTEDLGAERLAVLVQGAGVGAPFPEDDAVRAGGVAGDLGEGVRDGYAGWQGDGAQPPAAEGRVGVVDVDAVDAGAAEDVIDDGRDHLRDDGEAARLAARGYALFAGRVLLLPHPRGAEDGVDAGRLGVGVRGEGVRAEPVGGDTVEAFLVRCGAGEEGRGGLPRRQLEEEGGDLLDRLVGGGGAAEGEADLLGAELGEEARLDGRTPGLGDEGHAELQGRELRPVGAGDRALGDEGDGSRHAAKVHRRPGGLCMGGHGDGAAVAAGVHVHLAQRAHGVRPGARVELEGGPLRRGGAGGGRGAAVRRRFRLGLPRFRRGGGPGGGRRLAALRRVAAVGVCSQRLREVDVVLFAALEDRLHAAAVVLPVVRDGGEALDLLPADAVLQLPVQGAGRSREDVAVDEADGYRLLALLRLEGRCVPVEGVHRPVPRLPGEGVGRAGKRQGAAGWLGIGRGRRHGVAVRLGIGFGCSGRQRCQRPGRG
eukprot:gene8931-biopygen12311